MKKITIIALIIFAVALVGCKAKESSPPLTPKNLPSAGGRISFTDEIKSLEKVLEKAPKDLATLIKLGNLLMDAGRNEEAVSAYGRALEIDSNNQNVRVDMGVCYRRMGRPDIGVETIRKAIAMQPNHAMAHQNLGVILYDDFQQYPEAIKEFEIYLKLSPNAPNAQGIRELIQNLKSQPTR